MVDIAEVRKRRRPPTRSVALCLDQDLIRRRDDLRRRLDRQKALDERTNARDLAPDIERELDEVEEQIREATVTFTFRALPRVEWRRLVEAHPPTPDDVEAGLDFDPETIVAPLLAAAAVEPEMDLSDAEAIVDEWSEAEVTALFAAAFTVQREIRDIPLPSTGSAAAQT